MSQTRVIAIVAAALLTGATLQAGEVSAGRGQLIDWRTIRAGEPYLTDADAFDVARLFVFFVGPRLAIRAVAKIYRA